MSIAMCIVRSESIRRGCAKRMASLFYPLRISNKSYYGKRIQVNIRTLNCKTWTTMLSQERGNTYHALFLLYFRSQNKGSSFLFHYVIKITNGYKIRVKNIDFYEKKITNAKNALHLLYFISKCNERRLAYVGKQIPS